MMAVESAVVRAVSKDSGSVDLMVVQSVDVKAGKKDFEMAVWWVALLVYELVDTTVVTSVELTASLTAETKVVKKALISAVGSAVYSDNMTAGWSA